MLKRWMRVQLILASCLSLILVGVGNMPTAFAESAALSQSPQTDDVIRSHITKNVDMYSKAEIEKSIKDNIASGKLVVVSERKTATGTETDYETTSPLGKFGKLHFTMTRPYYSDRATAWTGSNYLTIRFTRKDQQVLYNATAAVIGGYMLAAVAEVLTGPLGWFVSGIMTAITGVTIAYINDYGVCPVSKPYLYSTYFTNFKHTVGCGK